MANNIAIQELMNTRNLLIYERDMAAEDFNNKISQLETAIETLSGKKVWEIESEIKYDDENPDYIKGSIEN